MEDIVNRLESLDNVQLRTELLKHGERVGPVTPTTRKVYLSKLAKKLYCVEHPDVDTESTNASDQSDKRRGEQASVAAPEQDSLASTPTGRKESLKNGGEKDGTCMYYVVVLADSSSTSETSGSDTGTAAEHRVFTEKLEALAFMKKNAGSRLKVFQNSADVKRFVAQSHHAEESGQTSEPNKSEGGGNSNNLALEAEKSAFRGPRIQELMQFRKLVEQGDIDTVKTTVWSNPRYLISGADTPVILHEGMRHNFLHIAAKANQADLATLLLETILDPEFTKLLYTNTRDTEQSRNRRIVYLFDLYLNSPDKGSAETPLHIACKMGHTAVVQSLVMYSATDRIRINKFGEKPEEIICSRYKGDKSASIKVEIQELLKGLCLVPLLRSVDNITLPVVGKPCSPDDKMKLYTSSTIIATPSLNHGPREPCLTLSAYAGPMSPSKARNFQKQWMNPRYLRNSADAQEFTTVRRADAEKGYERIGRKLARELHVPWTEYWQFLDAFADFSTLQGLHKLEQYLLKQQTQLAVLNAMKRGSSDEDSAGCTSSDSCEEDSEDECFYSCDEASEDEKHNDSKESKCQNSSAVVPDDDDDGDDVFEDSLDSFSDTKSYIFGQRLQLKKSTDSNGTQPQNGTKSSSKPNADVCQTQEKQSNHKSCFWSYRENLSSREEEKKASEISFTSDTTHSFDASGPSPDDRLDKPEEETSTCENSSVTTKKSVEGLDKSFNTAMTELSDDLETKLIFSPEGKVVPSKRNCLVPDVGLCIGKTFFSKHLHTVWRGQCPLEVLIKSKKGSHIFLADVCVHSYPYAVFSDVSDDDDLPDKSGQEVLMDVKIVARNALVFQYLRRIVRPVHLTVGILEPGMQDVAQHCGCVTARVIRWKRNKSQKTSCYIYGNTACKTDLDVMRAMCDVEVDSSAFPAVHSWLSLISATQKEGRDSAGSYMNADPGPDHAIPKFKSVIVPGVQLPGIVTRENLWKHLTPLSIFKRFFTIDLMQIMCNYTNESARLYEKEKPTLYNGWSNLHLMTCIST